MTKDLRRKQKKARKAARAAQRRAKAATKVQAPRFDASLPTTRAAIESEIKILCAKILNEEPGQVEHHAHGKTIHLTPAQAQLMRLRHQLFRVVFGREPGPRDPVFWDLNREAEGAFPIDPDEDRRTWTKLLTDAKIRPERAYAMALTGFVPMEKTAHLYKEEELDEWQEAVDDYVHQAATGVLPLVPEDFLHAWKTVNGVAAHSNVIPISRGSADTLRDTMIVTLQSELGTYEKAAAAMTRMAALLALTAEKEFADLVSPGGYSESAILAAACAEIDRRTWSFDAQSFRDRLDLLSED